MKLTPVETYVDEETGHIWYKLTDGMYAGMWYRPVENIECIIQEGNARAYGGDLPTALWNLQNGIYETVPVLDTLG